MEVRIDKYLWAIRVFKTRSEATDACKGGKIRVNGNDIKPSKSIKPGDIITARKGPIAFTYKVLALVEKRQGAKLVPNYAENITPQEELDKLRHPVDVRPKRTAARWIRCGIHSAMMYRTMSRKISPDNSDLILRMNPKMILKTFSRFRSVRKVQNISSARDTL